MNEIILEATNRPEALKILRDYQEGTKIFLKHRKIPFTIKGELYEERIRHGTGTYLCRDLEANGRIYRLQLLKGGDNMPWLSLYYPDGHEDSLCEEEHCKWKQIENIYNIKLAGEPYDSVCDWEGSSTEIQIE